MTKAQVPAAILALSISWAGAATPLYVAPDVPTNETLGGTTLLPWQIYRYDALAYAPVLSIPGKPTLADIHGLDKAGDWLFTPEAPSDLGGSLPGPAEARDVVRYTASTATYALFFCGASVTPPVPPTSRIDSLFLIGGDAGDLVVGFDVPTTLAGATYDPADLVRFVRTGPGCGGWSLAAVNPYFDASAAGTGIPTSSNVVGADRVGGNLILSFDVPTTVGPPGPVTYLPGQLVSWNGAAFGIFEPLAGWPTSSGTFGVSWSGNPGLVQKLVVDKAGANITVSWSASCSAGATDYGIYEGTIGTWYSHTRKVCTDTGGDLTETFAPAAASSYYLVVPRNSAEEGSYGQSSGGAERPVGAAVCVAPQVLTPCPP